MDHTNDKHPLQKAAELHLLAHVLELGHLTTPAIFMPIPMARGDKAQRFIFSGTRAEVERMLEMVPPTPTTSDLITVDCQLCAGNSACDECDGQGKVIVSRADMAALADHDHSEGGHHD